MGVIAEPEARPVPVRKHSPTANVARIVKANVHTYDACDFCNAIFGSASCQRLQYRQVAYLFNGAVDGPVYVVGVHTYNHEPIMFQVIATVTDVTEARAAVAHVRGE